MSASERPERDVRERAEESRDRAVWEPKQRELERIIALLLLAVLVLLLSLETFLFYFALLCWTFFWTHCKNGWDSLLCSSLSEKQWQKAFVSLCLSLMAYPLALSHSSTIAGLSHNVINLLNVLCVPMSQSDRASLQRWAPAESGGEQRCVPFHVNALSLSTLLGPTHKSQYVFRYVFMPDFKFLTSQDCSIETIIRSILAISSCKLNFLQLCRRDIQKKNFGLHWLRNINL